VKAIVKICHGVPEKERFPLIEWIISHYHIANAGNFQHPIKVIVRVSRIKESAGLIKVGRPRVQAKRLEDGTLKTVSDANGLRASAEISVT
jgi:hypothetical protein